MNLSDLAPLTHEEPVCSPLYTEVPEPFDTAAFFVGCVNGALLGGIVWGVVFLILWGWR